MNLPTLKAEAEKANTSPLELEIWQMEITPDDVLRLVEVARLAKGFAAWPMRDDLNRLAVALEGIEP